VYAWNATTREGGDGHERISAGLSFGFACAWNCNCAPIRICSRKKTWAATQLDGHLVSGQGIVRIMR